MYHRRSLIVLVAIVGLLLGPLARPSAAHTAPLPAAPLVVSPSHPSQTTTAATPARMGSIRGHVVRRGQAQRQAASVLALRGTTILRQGPIDPRGNYALHDLAPGAYTLSVVDRQQRALAPASNAQLRLAPGEARYLTLAVDGSAPALALTGIAPAAAACEASGTASIAGTIRAPDSTPIQNVLVWLYALPSGRQMSGVYTTNTGAYTFANLAAGSYLLQFDTRQTNKEYKGEWYDNQASQASATPIAVAEGATLTGIDVTLEAGAQITGKVTAGDTGDPLSSAYVEVYDSDENVVASAYTNTSGVYTTTPGLPGGSYTISFEPSSSKPYLAEYYDDKPDFASATRLTLTAPTVRTGVDAALARGAQITGRVTAADTGLGLPNISVAISSSSQQDTYAYTNSAGYYTTTTGLASDIYRLRFNPDSDTSDYIANQRTATVSAPNVLGGIDMVLQLGGQVKGRVTDATLAPLQYVSVYIMDETNDFEQNTSTDATGNYTFHGIPSGSYQVFFRKSAYIEEYYNNQPNYTLADWISVTAPQPVSGIDAVLEPGGSITGRVTAADTGLGLKDVDVNVYDLAGNQIDNTTTGASGHYTFTTILPSGTYLVQFQPRENGTACAYLAEYYNNQRTATSADSIGVTAPNTTPNIDAALERGSTISGRVTAAGSGAGLDDVFVAIYDSAGEFATWGDTGPSGDYRAAQALPSGSYRVGFFPSEDGPYLAEYYNNKPTLLASDTISVTAPNDKTGVDAALAIGGAISGTVTAAATGAPLQYTWIDVIDQSGASVGYGYTDAAGKYTTSALPSGSYRLQFSSGDEEGAAASLLQTAARRSVGHPTSTGMDAAIALADEDIRRYLDQYYSNKSTLEAADSVVVNAPATTANINAALIKGGAISGRVTAAGSGAPLPLVKIQVYDSQGEIVARGYTAADGTYTTYGGLPSGNYRLYFAPYGASASYAGEYYNDKASLDTATSITVSAPNNLTDINAVLAKGGRIAGTVTATDTGTALPGVDVEVYNSSGNLVALGQTATSGIYVTEPALPNGVYRVRFAPLYGPIGQYSPEYYNDKPTLASATTVAITTPATKNGINAALSKGAQVSGRIHAPGGSDPSDVQVVVYDSSGAAVATGETNPLGFYHAEPALRSGSYRIGFEPRAGSSYVASFYRGKLTLAGADSISITAPTARSGVDDTLLRAVYLPLALR